MSVSHAQSFKGDHGDLMTQTQRKLFVFGYGYTGRAFARAMQVEGWQVVATHRDPARAEVLRGDGVEPLLWPCTPVAFGAAMESVEALLVTAAPGPEGDPLLAAFEAELCQLRPALRWAGYLSSTAVYGDHGGAWVGEATPPKPRHKRGQRRLAAEQQWLALARAHTLPVHVFRLAGIYGAGRGPFEKLRRGKVRKIIKPGQVFGRIHIDDIVAALRVSMARPDPGRVYNVADDLSCPPEEVLDEAARLLRMPPLLGTPFAEAVLSSTAREFYSENKRVSNARLRHELGLSLNYPTYREGLRAILAEEQG